MHAASRRPVWSAVFVLGSVVGAATGLLLPMSLAAATDAVLGRHDTTAAFARLGLVLIISVSAQMLAGYGGSMCVIAGTAWVRRHLLRHVFALGVRGSGRFAVGDLTSRLLGDTAHVAQVLPSVMAVVISAGTSIGGVVALWLIDPWLGLTFLLVLPPALFVFRRFMIHSTDLHTRYQRLLAAIAVRLSDALTGVRTIRAAGTAGIEADRVLGPLPELAETGMATWRLQRRTVWQGLLLAPLMEALVIAVAGLGVATGRLTPGSLVAATGYVAIAVGFIGQIDSLMALASVRAGALRVVEVLSQPVQPTPLTPRPIPAGAGELEFRGVTVTVDGRVVLDRIDLHVPAGTSVALVGRSGTGKSTLAALAGRLADPDEGTVAIDGVDVTDLDPLDLGGMLGYAFERPTLLGDTVADAIGYGSATASREDVVHAATAVRADTFIRRLPAGYDSPLADTPLSGGEAQRLGLARAVVHQPRILVLDDATSSLDTATEAQVSATLTELFDGRTRLLVAHRATTAARADLVAWLDEGRVRALAPHAQLWREPDYRAVFGALEET